MKDSPLASGKLPLDFLSRLLNEVPLKDPDVVLGPGIGLDCAVVKVGDRLLVLKSDPITFATDKAAWYLVQVNANDIATTGARPRWLLVTALLPEDRTSRRLVETLFDDLLEACNPLGITLVGGHTEITHGLNRPILSGTLIGEVTPEKLVTPTGAGPGDRLLLTKSVPIEATAILAREFPEQLDTVLSPLSLEQAQNYLFDPGISVVQEAALAVQAGGVTAMHDPTEGGVAAALWELAKACGHTLVVDPDTVPLSPLGLRICEHFDLEPLAAIASGALLIAVRSDAAGAVQTAIRERGIACTQIGQVRDGPPTVRAPGDPDGRPFLRPERDAITAVYEN